MESGDGGSGSTWTRKHVEARLIAAFRQMPTCPVYGVGSRIRTIGDEQTPVTDALEWAVLLGDDRDAQRFLWTWARCQATGASFGELCVGCGWSRATAERGRRRGAETIAAKLSHH